jgi:tetratricopeptide (TPR) repeat protein
MRASLLLESDPAAAAQRAGKVLASSPGHAEASLLLAAAYRKLDDPAAAVAALEQIASTHLDTPLMQLELGRAYAASGRGAHALAAFQRAVALDARLAEGWQELSAQLFSVGDLPGGDAAYARYRGLTPDPQELRDALGALADNRLATAETILRRRLRQTPDDFVGLRILADIATRREDFAEAERLLLETLAQAPGYAVARYDLARLLYDQQRNAEVLPLVERLIASEPHNPDYVSLKAQALRLLGRNDEAIALLEQLLAGHPQGERAWLLFGHLLREVGQQSRAIQMYRQALQVRPESGGAYWSLANLKTFRFGAADLDAMRRQLGSRHVQGADRTQLEFALGKALEDEGRFAASFEHYARANSLQRTTVHHDADAATSDVRRLKSVFTADLFAGRCGWGSRRNDPIFIVGLPRSGSTLLEQVLATHVQVEGTRELPDVPAIVSDLMLYPDPGRRPYPEDVGALERAQIETLAARYLSRTQTHRLLGKPRFVDKMLINFGHVGLIHLMFPQAAIIDARRHPLGCGFSCYRQLFTRGMAYTYDLSDMGRYYRDYAELMEHFDTVLPGRIHRVHYELLVADPAGEIRKLLDYCGLPFEPQCLQFYENRRVVQTISSEQVRQPIFSDSVDQWRHYEPWLGPMKEALGDLVERYPTPSAALEPK